MIVLDLDGTLTNSEKKITIRTKEALLKAQKEGVIVVLASGRPTGGISPLANELNLEKFGGIVMAYNGGIIIDWKSKKKLFEQTLDQEFVPYLAKKAKQKEMAILTYQGINIAASNINNQYVQHEAFINKMPLIEYSDFINQVEYPIHKCLIVGNPIKLKKVEEEIRKEIGTKMSVYRSADFFLECMPMGVDKALSLERLCNMLSISADEIIACGDGYNDLSMIKFAGLGVAMNNANDDIKKYANFITLSNEEDGVAYVIDKFLLQSE